MYKVGDIIGFWNKIEGVVSIWIILNVNSVDKTMAKCYCLIDRMAQLGLRESLKGVILNQSLDSSAIKLVC